VCVLRVCVRVHVPACAHDCVSVNARTHNLQQQTILNQTKPNQNETPPPSPKHTQRERERERQRQRQRETQRETQRERDTHTHRHTISHPLSFKHLLSSPHFTAPSWRKSWAPNTRKAEPWSSPSPTKSPAQAYPCSSSSLPAWTPSRTWRLWARSWASQRTTVTSTTSPWVKVRRSLRSKLWNSVPRKDTGWFCR